MLVYDPPLDPSLPCPREELEEGGCYFPDPGLRDAVNVALTLGRPLLLTGLPGTGKTELAASVSRQLGLGRPLKFETKSQSVSRDLFYFYDALGRFQARESGAAANPLAYFSFNALGAAILRANEPEDVTDYRPDDFEHAGKQRSVVLIDEIDKAPRDFPNDLLNEIEHMYFRIPELGNVRISASPDMRPIVIVTSNSEKDLPDPFLRRCVYYNIPSPDPQRLRAIALNRLGETVAGLDAFVDDAVALFAHLRSEAIALRKTPSTAELLDWVQVLRRRAPDLDNPIRQDPEVLRSSLSALIKTREDQDSVWDAVEPWLTRERI
jgi:MoxR-like ATPase